MLSTMPRHIAHAIRWAATGLLLLAAGCGGGGSSGTGGTGQYASGPGTGGTGYPGFFAIQVSGSISGFGSVIVNGVRFDDSLAAVRISGQSASPAQLGLGMSVSVSGTATATSASSAVTSAVATSIETWSIAQGVVTAKTPHGITVAGMVIASDAVTVFPGTTSFAALAVGDTVQVWGNPLNASYTGWLATRIEPASASAPVISSGPVGGKSSALTLNGFSLSGATSGLAVGRAATLLGTATGAALSVSSVHLLDAAPLVASGTQLEQEGAITSVTSSTLFKIGNYPVDAGGAVVKPTGMAPALSMRVEVDGVWNGTALVAKSVEYKTQTELQSVELESTITAFTSLSDFVVRGLLCDASSLTSVANGQLSELKVGVKIHLRGVNMGNRIQVTSLSIDR